jgi:hypothetical protein
MLRTRMMLQSNVSVVSCAYWDDEVRSGDDDPDGTSAIPMLERYLHFHFVRKATAYETPMFSWSTPLRCTGANPVM